MWNWIKKNKFIAGSLLVLGWLTHAILETVVINLLTTLAGIGPITII